eukprot:2339504-Pleurochrysis_carterae.AAC.2
MISSKTLYLTRLQCSACLENLTFSLPPYAYYVFETQNLMCAFERTEYRVLELAKHSNLCSIDCTDMSKTVQDTERQNNRAHIRASKKSTSLGSDGAELHTAYQTGHEGGASKVASGAEIWKQNVELPQGAREVVCLKRDSVQALVAALVALHGSTTSGFVLIVRTAERAAYVSFCDCVVSSSTQCRPGIEGHLHAKSAGVAVPLPSGRIGGRARSGTISQEYKVEIGKKSMITCILNAQSGMSYYFPAQR